MGRSARWHDTDLQAEIAAQELFGSPQGLLRTVVGVGLGGGIPLRVGWLLVRALRS